MKDRIKSVRNSKGMSQEKFAKELLMSRSAVCKLESGENYPSEQTIELICVKFGVNEDWLRTGNGDMYPKKTREQEIGAFANEVMKLPDENFKKRLVSALTKLDKRDWEALEKLLDSISQGSD